MTRRQIREHILRLIFDYSFCSPGERAAQAELYFEQAPDEELPNPPGLADEEERAYISKKAMQIAKKIPKIDQLLNDTAIGWTTRRMGKTDLAVLRLAVYEILYDENVPAGVAINEAVELAKIYCEEEAPAFINGILAKVVPSEKKDGQ